MMRSRLIVFAMFVVIAAWGSRHPTEAFHSGYTFISGGGCGTRLFGFTNHAHSCSASGGFGNACESWCEGEGISATCTDNTSPPNTSSGLCECGPPVCCEANGCAQGHGGFQWSPDHCAPPPAGGRDLCGCCFSTTPLIVSLRSEAISLSSAENGVVFDFFGDGHKRRFAWPITSDDAWLVLDRNHNGQVDSGVELFGNAAYLASGQQASNGYEVLDELDANHDGVVDAV